MTTMVSRNLRPAAIGLVAALLSSGVALGTGSEESAKRAGRVVIPAGTEPSGTEVRLIDETHVVFQYGEPVPSFDTWDQRQAGRGYLSLDGEWKFKRDPREKGVAQEWFAPGLDDSSWRTRKVPLPWDLYNTPGFGRYDGSRYGKGSAFYDGDVWFRKQVMVDPGWQGRFTKLVLLGAGYKTWVYVNGQLIGIHEGGMTPFALDVTDHLNPGRDNLFALRVHRRPSFNSYTSDNPDVVVEHSAVPYKPVDFWPYAGITRSVYLEATPQVTVSKVLTSAERFLLRATVIIYNHGDQAARRQLTFDPGKGSGGAPQATAVDIGPGESRAVEMAIPIPQAEFWDVFTPRMYEATASLSEDTHPASGSTAAPSPQTSGNPTVSVAPSLQATSSPSPAPTSPSPSPSATPQPDDVSVDTLSVVYGMRSIETRGSALELNGRKLFLKGVNWHEETREPGRSMSREDYDRTFGHFLDLGVSAIRNSHYNRHPYAYELADSMGLLVIDEPENMWLKARQQRLQTTTVGLSRSLVLTTAWNQMNHPSVIMWSLQNESSKRKDPAAYKAWISDMRTAVKLVDVQKRPVTWASKGNDPAFGLADVIGINEYYGYKYGRDRGLGRELDDTHRKHPGKPILITENGTSSTRFKDGSPNPRGTERWRSRRLLAHWKQVVDRLRFMAGYIYWVLKDYKQRSNYNQRLNGISTWGLMTLGERPRRVYKTYRDLRAPRS